MPDMDYQGCQIFIACSNEDFRQSLVEFLRNSEFEAYGIDDPVAVDTSERRDSIFFLNNKDMNTREWIKMAEDFDRSGSACSLIALGETDIPNGFQGAVGGQEERYGEAIIGYLRNAEAQGYRRHVRFGNQIASIGMFEFHRDNRRFAGVVHDISVAGCSCTFKPEPKDFGYIEVEKMNVNLHAHSLLLSGRFVSRRRFTEQVIHVFQFNENLPEKTVNDIHEFIYESLETKLSFR